MGWCTVVLYCLHTLIWNTYGWLMNISNYSMLTLVRSPKPSNRGLGQLTRFLYRWHKPVVFPSFYFSKLGWNWYEKYLAPMVALPDKNTRERERMPIFDGKAVGKEGDGNGNRQIQASFKHRRLRWTTKGGLTLQALPSTARWLTYDVPLLLLLISRKRR